MMKWNEASADDPGEAAPTMSVRLKSIRIQNYRSLADVSLDLKPINVLFGPSGAGKSSLLDAIGFVRDCVERSVEFASAKRGLGLGLLNDGAAPSEPIRLKLATDQVEYELTLGLSSGRIDPLPGERLYSLDLAKDLIERAPGTARVRLYDIADDRFNPTDLREPERLSLARFLDQNFNARDILDLKAILSSGRLYHSRSLKFGDLKRLGSAAGIESHVLDHGENLWSVLRVLEGRRLLDDRYATIMRYMAEAFPTFKGLVIDQVAPTVLYGSFLEKDKQKPILASGISDGHLQFLILLTVLFVDEPRSSLVMVDEPENSLHPWVLAVLAKAIREATTSWGRQVILATHSPALINEFDPDEQLAVETQDGRTQITRVNEIEDVRRLLEDYSTGSLYMAEAIAPQSRLVELSTPGR
jgi:predicted ATPase